MNLPQIPGGKNDLYEYIHGTTAIVVPGKRGKDPMMAKLADIVEANNGIWNLRLKHI